MNKQTKLIIFGGVVLKKILKASISVILVLAIAVTTCTSALAASSSKTYVKEMIISYGNTADEAKKWLTDNEYEVLDYNLNDGADNTLSTKRAVYIGYKTTNKADEAITDLRLMNMNGGYSVQDYQMMLNDQKESLKLFFNNFKVAVAEYRKNYKAGQARALAAYNILNMLYDDDTQQNLGDLLLNKVREEYTDEEYAALSDEEKAKVADMTTILMQGNADAILTMEQTIATAADNSDTTWVFRYETAKTYDELLDELKTSKKLTVNDAVKQLALEYDDDAKKIASNFESYKELIAKNEATGLTLASTDEEIEAYQKEHDDFSYTTWYSALSQIILLKGMMNDDVSLYDLIYSDEYDIQGEDRYLLYPLVSVLSEGQRACLDFVSTYQLIALGINDDSAIEETMQNFEIISNGEIKNISIYNGIDRSVFDGDVALTSEAYRLQASSGKQASDSWSAPISATTIALWSSLVVVGAGTIYAWAKSPKLSVYATKDAAYAEEIRRTKAFMKKTVGNTEYKLAKAKKALDQNDIDYFTKKLTRDEKSYTDYVEKYKEAASASKSSSRLANFVTFAKIAGTCIVIALLAVSLWRTIVEIKEYYNAKFTPIPSNMVDQSEDENNEKVYTYYKAVKCNRVEQNMVTDATKLLGDYGDLNGDVGRQWVALYTTTDKAAGNPVTTDFIVQTANSNLPNDSSTALSMFGESVAQNLTNKKMGYTYADSKDGIYMFYNTDSSAFAASVFSNATYVLVGAAGAAALVAVFFVGRAVGKKAGKKKEGESENV